MFNLIGTYECKADAKGRLPLPAPLRKQMSGFITEGFVLKRSVFQNCLELYPMLEWQKVMKQISELNRFNQKNNEFIRRFSAGVKLVEPDANGRIQISKDLITFADIKKEVVLSSTINIIEIWDKKRYEAAVNNTDVDFAALTEQVIGNASENGLS